jgi:hypothetical protein
MEKVTTMTELSMNRRREILESLGSTTCGACGGPKQPRMSHCSTCYYALPQYMRKALYQRFGEGYEQAYEESLVYLKNLKREA